MKTKETALIHKEQTGFTYIEILIAVVILGVVLIPMLNQFYIGFRGNKTAEILTQGANLGEDMMEEIKSKRFDESEFPDPVTASANLGLDPGEAHSDRLHYNDVDDYTGLNNKPPKDINGNVLNDFSDFSRSVTVDYVMLNAGSEWVSSPDATYYKRIIVRVSHPEIEDIVLETIVSYY